ncbi:hypothetical protein V2I01_31985 [Micromonospora sp. BRA006-A]|nr:hypothetical protein [Micromonospora sp. BRA006-A]
MAVGFGRSCCCTNPLTYPTADVISTYLYRVGIVSGNLSYAAAIGLFESVIGLTLVLSANAISGARWGRACGEHARPYRHRRSARVAPPTAGYRVFQVVNAVVPDRRRGGDPYPFSPSWPCRSATTRTSSRAR